VSVPATAEEVKQNHLGDSKPKLPTAKVNAAPDEGPTYQVYLAPMRYDANLKVQPAPDPKLIVLVRRVRVRPTLIFQGTVEGDALVAENRPVQPIAAAPTLTPTQQPATQKPPAANASVMDRMKTFLKNIWSSKS
jgi:hypothetical protein